MFLTVSLIAAFAAVPADAHWQYTQWGMSKEQVVSASKGTAHSPSTPDIYNNNFLHLLSSTYKTKDLTFSVSFLFDQSKKLVRVKLEPQDTSKCASLEAYLSNSYGPAYFTERMSTDTTLKWRDEKNKNIIMYFKLPMLNTCSVSYDPIISAGSKGGL